MKYLILLFLLIGCAKTSPKKEEMHCYYYILGQLGPNCNGIYYHDGFIDLVDCNYGYTRILNATNVIKKCE